MKNGDTQAERDELAQMWRSLRARDRTAARSIWRATVNDWTSIIAAPLQFELYQKLKASADKPLYWDDIGSPPQWWLDATERAVESALAKSAYFASKMKETQAVRDALAAGFRRMRRDNYAEARAFWKYLRRSRGTLAPKIHAVSGVMYEAMLNAHLGLESTK